jgi:enoyl-CoA hydratase/carnithine racemase
MCSDIRLSSTDSKTAFLFTRVGLAGCDMGACAILPRIIGQGRAAEWLLSGRSVPAEEALGCGFYSRLLPAGELRGAAAGLARTLAEGPTFAHGITKTMLNQEWNMGIDQAIESEAQAQALCMKTEDFRRAYEAFAAKRRPEFQGN